MGIKIYKRIGLRRDKNLGDLSDPTTSLNNLLNGLTIGGNYTFITEDLDAIRGISSLGLKSDGYRQFISSRQTYTSPSGTQTDFFPRITYQNRLDRLRLFSGEPRLYGGNGLTAKYYNKNQVFPSNATVFSGLPFKTDNFWEAGVFTYTGKITPESIDVNGGVEWDGYFIPERTGQHTFYVTTTGLNTLEFQTIGDFGNNSAAVNFLVTKDASVISTIKLSSDGNPDIIFDGNNLGNISKTIKYNVAYKVTGSNDFQTIVDLRVSNSGKTLELDDNYSVDDNDYNDLIVSADNGYFYTVGNDFYYTLDSYVEQSRIGITTTFAATGSINTNAVTLSSAANTNYIGIGQSVVNANIVSGTTVDSYDRSSGIITLKPPTGTTYAVSSTFTDNVTFSKTIGQSTKVYYTTYVLEKFRKYRIRFRYYIPQNIDAISAQRNIIFNVLRPNGSSDEFLRFNSLYSLDYDFTNASKGDFVNFLDNSLTSGGGTCGGTLSSNDYVKIQTSKKVDIKYQPKSSVSDIIKLIVSGTTTNNSSVVTLSSTSGLEIGNYVYGTNIADGTTVKEIIINQSVILTANAIGSGTVNLTFIDHRGFVKSAVGSGSAGSFTLSSGDTSNLKNGMIMIGSGVQTYTGITTTGSASAFTISPSQTIGAGTTVYFYQSRGLINNALDPFCPIADNKCAIVTVAAGIGSTIIQVNTTTGISNGWSVQGFQFASGTTVTGITATTISLSAGITKNLVVGGNFTVTNGTADKTLCCPPTDTSPPFNPTVDGLETVSAAPNLKIDSGNVKFESLRVAIASTITSYTSSNLSGSRLSIQTPSGTFKILCE